MRLWPQSRKCRVANQSLRGPGQRTPRRGTEPRQWRSLFAYQHSVVVNREPCLSARPIRWIDADDTTLCLHPDEAPLVGLRGEVYIHRHVSPARWTSGGDDICASDADVSCVTARCVATATFIQPVKRHAGAKRVADGPACLLGRLWDGAGTRARVVKFHFVCRGGCWPRWRLSYGSTTRVPSGRISLAMERRFRPGLPIAEGVFAMDDC
jgi:hypothetical protein